VSRIHLGIFQGIRERRPSVSASGTICRGRWLTGCAAAALAVTNSLPVTAAERPPRRTLETVEVVGTTPLEGLNVPRDQVPANVQSASGAELAPERTSTLASFMNERLASVHINEAQSNPWQPDVSFRGFAASPLLGNPIGMSVFVDGVRVNESFGDTVLWDLIPTSAIDTVDLLPGAGAVFGLNTLGGALALRTRSGRTAPGVNIDVSGGSFGRLSGEVSAGGSAGALDGFLAIGHHEEDGWRDHSLSRVRQLFAKAGWESATSRVALSYMRADNRLIGNGLVPEPLFAERRESVYTYPDETEPTLDFLNLIARHDLGAGWQLAGNAYWRRVHIRTFNGDAEYDDGDTPFDFSDDEYEAENRRTRTAQNTVGAALQLAYEGRLAGRDNYFALGVSRDKGRADFQQLEQEAEFTNDRGTIGEGEFELDTHVYGKNVYDSIYLTDTLALDERTHLTLSGRYTRARVEIEDRSGEQPDLNGRHTFNRVTPAAGITYALTPAITLYGGYNEGFRVPTPVELTCADPDDPCSLPVGFVADPPLEPVISRSWELGARGTLRESMRWNATLYRTRLTDDILFTSVGASQGFFANVPATRRQGVELGLFGQLGTLSWEADYSYVDATFRSDAELFNPVALPSDPSQPASIQVTSGDRLPGVPRHLFKLGVEWQPTPALTLGAQTFYASGQYLRGDESNLTEPLGGYTLVGLRAAYEVADGLRLYARVDNAFDKEYETLGAYNRNGFDGNEPLEGVGPGPVERFISPGTPRSYWVGIQYTLGGDE